MATPKHLTRALLTPEARPGEPDQSIRPLSLAEFVGQRAARANMQIFSSADATAETVHTNTLAVLKNDPQLAKYATEA